MSASTATKTRRKGPAKAGPERGPTIVISDDFIGLKDADGNVLIDDTAHFAHEARVKPVADRIYKHAGVQECRAELDRIERRVRRINKDVGDTLGSRLCWFEQAMVLAFTEMLEEAKKDA